MKLYVWLTLILLPVLAFGFAFTKVENDFLNDTQMLNASLVDFDRDGLLDLFYQTPDSQFVHCELTSPDSLNFEQVGTYGGVLAQTSTSCKFADFNNDGLWEMITQKTGTNQYLTGIIHLYTQQSPGSYEFTLIDSIGLIDNYDDGPFGYKFHFINEQPYLFTNYYRYGGAHGISSYNDVKIPLAISNGIEIDYEQYSLSISPFHIEDFDFDGFEDSVGRTSFGSHIDWENNSYDHVDEVAIWDDTNNRHAWHYLTDFNNDGANDFFALSYSNTDQTYYLNLYLREPESCFYLNASTNQITVGQTVDFTCNTGYNPAVQYAWDFDNDGVIDSNQQNPSYTYTVSGHFTPTLQVTTQDQTYSCQLDHFISVQPVTGDIVFNQFYQSEFPQGTVITDVVPFDFNGNGYDEIVISATNEDTSWLRCYDCDGTLLLEETYNNNPDTDMYCAKGLMRANGDPYLVTWLQNQERPSTGQEVTAKNLNTGQVLQTGLIPCPTDSICIYYSYITPRQRLSYDRLNNCMYFETLFKTYGEDVYYAELLFYKMIFTIDSGNELNLTDYELAGYSLPRQNLRYSRNVYGFWGGDSDYRFKYNYQTINGDILLTPSLAFGSTYHSFEEYFPLLTNLPYQDDSTLFSVLDVSVNEVVTLDYTGNVQARNQNTLELQNYTCYGSWPVDGHPNAVACFNDSTHVMLVVDPITNQLLETHSPELIPDTMLTVNNNIPLMVKNNNGLVTVFGRDQQYLVDTNEQLNQNPVRKISASNYPNPFNPQTAISYNLPQGGKIKLEVYNLKGQKVSTLVNQQQPAGDHTTIWKGQDQQNRPVASGVYLYRLEANGQTINKKMLLLK